MPADPAMFVRGLALGFSIAAPVGPIGVLCIRRTLAAGRLAGFCSGLGAATADAAYGAIAALGLTAVASVLVGQQAWLRLLGGLFLCYLGARIFLAAPAAKAAAAPSGSRGLLGLYLSTLALTLTNPTTMLSFVAIFAGMGFAADGASPSFTGALLVTGVFLGSGLWWLILSSGVGLARARVTAAMLRWINRASGGVIFAFGALALVSLAS